MPLNRTQAVDHIANLFRLRGVIEPEIAADAFVAWLVNRKTHEALEGMINPFKASVSYFSRDESSPYGIQSGESGILLVDNEHFIEARYTFASKQFEIKPEPSLRGRSSPDDRPSSI